jgi:hypothetical protein
MAEKTARGIATDGIDRHLAEVRQEARGEGGGGGNGSLRARVIRCALREASATSDFDELAPYYVLAALRELKQREGIGI